ncbi:MAG: putative C-S lyase [Bacteroidales bacterium]|nr:MAG: putative C-S lyase [Bacteroidales bacterium]
MEHFNFDQIIARKNTSCEKYDLRESIFGNENVLPMWVADMDFASPDFILTALASRIKHPILGYTHIDKTFTDTIAWWNQKRHKWVINPDSISVCAGVVSGLNHAIQAYTRPGDKIIIQTPVYHPFFSTISNNGRIILQNPLIEKELKYSMDYENLEELASQGAKMVIISNPHNPVGRVWAKDELIRLGEICYKHKILVVSDEIHSDLIIKPHKHTPFASISEAFSMNTVTFASTSKTFNLAGLSTGHVIIQNPELHSKFKKALESTGAGMGNIFGFEAVKAAYTPKGEQWLEEALEYIKGNALLVEGFISSKLPKIKLSELQGTYLLWLDFRGLGLDDESISNLLVNRAEVGLSKGSIFGEQGKCFQRMNIACPRSTVQEALDRIYRVFKDI